MDPSVEQYKCPTCKASLHFFGQRGKLFCSCCDKEYPIVEIEAYYAKKEEEKRLWEEQQTRWDYSAISEDWGSDGEGMHGYSCPSCGAELICDATTAATSCPYCGNNAILTSRFAGALKPDLILPFKLEKKDAIAALKKHYRKNFLLPRAFSAGNHVKKVQGVYVPFWLYDARVDADCRFTGQKSGTRKEGENEYSTTEYYDVTRKGSAEFKQVPVDGSSKMDNAYMDSLEPFDYSQCKPFSTAYLPGYLADRYDQSAAECAKRADLRCEKSTIHYLYRDVSGYDTVLGAGSTTYIHRGQVHYALMPVWVLHTRWRDKDYLFMMNGQTGKLVGDLPVDKTRLIVGSVVLTALFSSLLFFSRITPFLASLFW